jgi:Ni,Fe-hydrogenase I large subunit
VESLYLPQGVILDRDLSTVHPYDPELVKEYISSSWYEYAEGDQQGLHPYAGETKARYTGPPTPWTYLQGEQKYSWMKSPRYDGRAVEVGPLARMLVAYASGHEEVRDIVGEVLGRLNVGPGALFSTLGRTAARGMETVLLSRRMSVWYDQLVERIRSGDTATFAKERWDPSTWPSSAQGYGFLDAPRGALGHWIRIEDGRIARYQCVVPSTWNASPRDPQGQMGAYEASLTDNHPLLRPEQPLEILRTIHSFDPCIACGVHVLDTQGRVLTEVKVQ